MGKSVDAIIKSHRSRIPQNIKNGKPCAINPAFDSANGDYRLGGDQSPADGTREAHHAEPPNAGQPHGHETPQTSSHGIADLSAVDDLALFLKQDAILAFPEKSIVATIGLSGLFAVLFSIAILADMTVPPYLPLLSITLLPAVSIGISFYIRWKKKHIDAARCYSFRCITLIQLGRQVIRDGNSPDVLRHVIRSAADVMDLTNAELEVQLNGSAIKAMAAPDRRNGPTYRIDLRFRGESCGRFIAYANEDNPLGHLDQMLLEEFAQELATNLHTVTMNGTLYSHQHRLVSQVRNEVQCRIQRDLHDGLGPILAAVKMQVDSVRTLMRIDPDAADMLLEQVGAETENAVASVRRLVTDLRTPAIHSMGLLAALAEQSRRFQQASAGRLQIKIEAPARLPALPERVELAAFRIASEALTNIAKHAQARSCVMRVRVDGDLRLDIVDDGIGIPGRSRAGIGLASMRGRAQDLGGECTIARCGTRGTHVAVRLPFT
jgi:signal transduction histidine kinase